MPVPNHYLKRERQLKGWSQVYLAKQIEVPDYYISRWERGEVTPSPYYQQKLCDLFGMTAEELGFLQPNETSFLASSDEEEEDTSSEYFSSISRSEKIREHAGNEYASPRATKAPPDGPPISPAPAPQYTRLHPLIIIALLFLVGAAIVDLVFSFRGLPSFSAHQQPVVLAHTATSDPTARAPTATSKPAVAPTPISDPPVLSATLAIQDASQWDEYQGNCEFQDNAYVLFSTHRGSYDLCHENEDRFCNFAFQVDMTMISGGGGGLIFRFVDRNSMERFTINSEGSYNLAGVNAAPFFGTTSALHKGFGQSNTLMSVVRGNTIEIYVNGQLIGTDLDSGAPSCGQVGFLAYDSSQDSEVQFSNVKVWNLK